MNVVPFTPIDNIKMKIVTNKHTCTGSKQASQGVANTQSWLCGIVSHQLYVTHDTEFCEIGKRIQLHFNGTVNSRTGEL